MASTIGPHTFLQMSRPPIGAKRDMEVESRAGVDGVALWNTGTRGQQFNIETLVDVPGGITGVPALLASYKSMIGSGPHQVIYAGTYSGVQVEVLDVEPLEAYPTLNAAGGIFGGNAMLRCRWQLIPV